MHYTLRVEYDDNPECPMDFDGSWTLVSFSDRSIHGGKPSDYFRVKDGEIVPANIGLRRKLEVGLAFPLQYFEHGQGRYDIQGAGPRCQWDTSDYAGILLWENKPGDMGAKTLEDRRKDAEGFLEAYNAWMNGHVYGYSLENEDGEDVDSCWGFYDTPYMSEEIAANFHDGDTVEVVGDCADCFDESKLPAGVLAGSP